MKKIAPILILLGVGATVFYLWQRNRGSKLPDKSNYNIYDNPITQAIQTGTDTIKAMTNAGIRNNNPVNIEYNRNNNWTGQTGQSGRWAVFSAPEYGFRAGGKLLDTYANKYGLNTIAAILPRFAPKNENDTKAYINFVAKRSGILAFSPITRADYPKVLEAMSKFETGKTWPMELILKGLAIK